MYIILLGFLFLMALGYKRSMSMKLVINSAYQQMVRVDRVYIFLAIIFTWFVLAFKSISVGTDVSNYKFFYEYTVDEYFGGNFRFGLLDQYLYYLIIFVMKKMGVSFFGFCLILYSCVAIQLWIYIKEVDNPMQVLLLVICLGFGMYCSALRQVMASMFGYWAIRNQITKNTTRDRFMSLGLIIIAVLIHKTAIILIVPYILSSVIKGYKQLIAFGIVGGCLMLLFPTSLIAKLAVAITDEYTNVIGESSNILYVMIYGCIMSVIILGIICQRNLKESDKILAVYAFFGILLVFLSTKLYILSRLSFFFLLPICIMFSYSLNRVCGRIREGKIVSIFVLLLFVISFLYTLINNATGIYPYQFIWD